jgi:hypothetical protein
MSILYSATSHTRESISGVTVSIPAQILSFRFCRSLHCFIVSNVLLHSQYIKSRTIKYGLLPPPPFSYLTAGLPGDFLLQTLPVSLSDRTCSGCCSHAVVSFYSFLNLRWTLNNDFASANHKTHCAFPLSVYIIKRAQRRQRQTDRHWDVVTLSEH